MPGAVKKALTSTVAGAKAAVRKIIAVPTIPTFPEIAKNTLISGKIIKEAIQKKVDVVKDTLDPTKLTDQLTGDKKTGIIASITPTQIKDLAKAAKQGSKLTPKEAITGTLEKFTGVNLDQDNLLGSLGGAVLDNITSEINALKASFMQTVLGCINKAIRDLLNKFPTIDFLINLEDRLNGILGKFRNQLEFKIDAELRGLVYNKIKIHQLTLFKQRLHGQIRDICPEATPASSAEVKELMDAFEEGKRRREQEFEDTERKNQIDELDPPSPRRTGESSTRDPVPDTTIAQWRNNPDKKQQDIMNKSDQIVGTLNTSIQKDQKVSNNTVSSIVKSRHRFKGGARLMQLSKRQADEPVETAAGLRMKILPEGNRVLPNPPTPGY